MAAVNFNSNPRDNFKVEREIRQGYPLTPYIFLIVEEALTHMIKKAVKDGRLKGIVLPIRIKQQSISEYANESFIMIRGEKRYVDKLMRLLKVFSTASGMKINWK